MEKFTKVCPFDLGSSWVKQHLRAVEFRWFSVNAVREINLCNRICHKNLVHYKEIVKGTYSQDKKITGVDYSDKAD